MKTTVLAVLAGMAAWGAAAGEAVPGGIAYRGTLRDPVEGALTGARTVSFRVFKDAAGGDPLWSRDLEVWCAAGGLFHAWLEGGEELAEAFAEPERFLEMQVEDCGDAIQPRVAFTAVPQAFLARRARQASLPFGVAGNLAVSNALEVTDAASFGAGAAFDGDLAVAGNAAWTDADSAVEVSGAVKAASFEGDGIAPVGSIVMWRDPERIPEGWAVCDGSNGTPDLRNRFLVGVGGEENYAYGQTGGADSVALTVEEMPPHQHGYTTAGDRTFHFAGLGWHDSDWWQSTTGDVVKHGSTDSAGNGKGHENRPPFYAVLFIMRVE